MTCKKRLAAMMASLVWLASASGTALAAISAAPESRLTELDEIRVHGQSLVERIEAAEDAFFARYNEVNTQRRYAIRCGVTHVDPDSLAMERKCVPEHRIHYAPVSYYMPDVYGFRSTCSAHAYSVASWNSHFDGCLIGNGREVFVTMGSPEADARYAAHVLKVVTGDARLLDQAAELKELYAQLDAASARYVELKPKRGTSRTRANPRGM